VEWERSEGFESRKDEEKKLRIAHISSSRLNGVFVIGCHIVK